jgi:hypothetical protein
MIAMLTVWLCCGFCLCSAGETISESYITEYSTDKIEMHTGAVHPGQKVVLVGDLGVHQHVWECVPRAGISSGVLGTKAVWSPAAAAEIWMPAVAPHLLDKHRTASKNLDGSDR